MSIDRNRAVDITNRVRRLIDENITLEQNNEYTRHAIASMIDLFLTGHGLHSYMVVCDETNNPENSDYVYILLRMHPRFGSGEIMTQLLVKFPDLEYRKVRDDRDKLEDQCRHLRGKLRIERREGKVRVVNMDLVG